MQALREKLEASGFRFIDNEELVFIPLWQEFERNHKNLTLDYTLATQEYQYAYFSHFGIVKNESKVLCLGREPVAVWPVFQMTLAGERKEYTSNGGPLLKPFYSDTLSPERYRQLSAIVEEAIGDWILKGQCVWYKEDIIGPEVTPLHQRMQREGASIELGYIQKVNLDRDINSLFSEIRKSYKNLINKSLNQFEVEVHEAVGEPLWTAFREAHFREAGRKTRSDKSWDIQYQQVNRGEAVLVTAAGKDKIMGFGLFNYNRNQSIYAVGVYDRSMFDRPIGHGIQWKAIEFFRNKGLKEHILGELPGRDEKDIKVLNIANFKKGFGRPHLFIKIASS